MLRPHVWSAVLKRSIAKSSLEEPPSAIITFPSNQKKNATEVRSRTPLKLIALQAVCDTPIAWCGGGGVF